MRALRAVSSERGRDPREFALIAYGGAGPIHAAGLAAQLDIRTVRFPHSPASSRRWSAFRPTRVPRCAHLSARAARTAPEELERLFEAMRSAIERRLPRENEYLGQAPMSGTGAELGNRSVSLSGSIRDSSLEELIERFEAEHEPLYGVRARAGSPVEVRALRLAAIGPPRTSSRLRVAVTAARGTTRQAHLAMRRRVETPVVSRGESAPSRGRARSSSTSTTRPSSCRPAGRCARRRRRARRSRRPSARPTSARQRPRPTRSPRRSRNAFASIADEMATTIFRTAHSTVVRDVMDFSASLCDPPARRWPRQ